MFIFSKKKKEKNTNKTEKNIFYFWKRARQGLTLLLHISIKGENQGYVVLWIRLFVGLMFLIIWKF